MNGMEILERIEGGHLDILPIRKIYGRNRPVRKRVRSGRRPKTP
jgi:hypothetical protein